MRDRSVRRPHTLDRVIAYQVRDKVTERRKWEDGQIRLPEEGPLLRSLGILDMRTSDELDVILTGHLLVRGMGLLLLDRGQRGGLGRVLGVHGDEALE